MTDPAGVAAGARTWQDVSVLTRTCLACPELVESRSRVVPGELPPAGADLLLVGEAPGAQEDAAGVPFVGKAGQVLDQLLAEAGIERDRVAVANVLKCRPPANRKPRRSEVERCRPWLARQIAVADPVLLVALGGTAAEWFFGPAARIGALRGQVETYDGRPVLVTFHPSAAIRFGPAGAPMAALRADLAEAAQLLPALRVVRGA